jgi:hypothetical protein
LANLAKVIHHSAVRAGGCPGAGGHPSEP